MSLETWLAFAAASAIMLAIPGPTILLVISYALGHGRKTALATVSGVTLGDFTAMTASLAGLGALLATSSTLFTVLKLIGAAYLMYLGIKLWRAPIVTGPMGDNDNLPEEKPLKIMAHAYLVTALNPKSIVFFIAFVPQFLDMHKPFLPQTLILEATFLDARRLERASLRLFGRHGARLHPQGKRATGCQSDRRNAADRGRRCDRGLPPTGRVRSSALATPERIG